MIDLLLEVGFEEFPTSFLSKSAEELSKKIEDLLVRERIFYRTIRTIYTSKRIGALILGLSRKQRPQIIEIQGPPKKYAYTEDGKVTNALAGFMKANDLGPNQIRVSRTPKGEYVVGKKEIAGKSTEEILYNEVPKIITSLEFPKTMVWNETKVRFPRPIRWIVALLDRKPLRFEYAGVKADRYSMPNFHFSFDPVRMEKPREYISFLRHGGVVVDPNERRKIILTRIKQLANVLKGNPVYDSNMIEEINCTTEYPDVVNGEFDSKFLELPKEVLATSLKACGNLIWLRDTNKFICVFGAKKKAAENIKNGYARVLRARLADALFYYQNDLKQKLEDMLEQTRGMVWIKGLGSIYEKVFRLSKFVEYFKNIPEIEIEVIKRAALLCKADLLSQMVREKEFTSLQGIMGFYYAKANGEGEKVAKTIKEHYQPRFAGDELPETRNGAVLSIADKLDNIVGAFLSGQKPSGSYDPLGVRRNGYAVINLIDINRFNFSLFDAIDNILKLYKRSFDNNILHEFFSERLIRYLEDRGFRYDEVNAILANWDGNATDARLRCEALKELRNKPEFIRLVIGQKRVRNILKEITKIGPIDATLLSADTEKHLYNRGQVVANQLSQLFVEQNYSKILNLLLSLRSDIDKFFDDVLVMCDDLQLRNNRLALVNLINQLFLRFADLSQIVVEASEKGTEKKS